MASPIYKQNSEVAKKEREELWSIIHSLKESAPPELYSRLQEAMSRVDESCRPKIPISRNYMRVGVGLSKSEKAIACDQMSAIIKQIKALKGW